MKLKDLFLAQLDREAAITRRMIARVPDGRPDWKPHPKSMNLGYLAVLVATLPSWIDSVISKDELDVAPEGGAQGPTTFATTRELVESFEAAVSPARQAFLNTTDEHLMTPWRMLAAGHFVEENPRYLVICDTFTHWAHHRGQLSVYLRLNDVPLASIYGPTADEPAF